MTPDDRDNAEVTYTVKELLGQIKDEQTKGFGRLETAMSGKADKTDVVRLETRFEARFEQHATELEEHKDRLGSLEQSRRDQTTAREATNRKAEFQWSRWQRAGGLTVGTSLVVGAILEVLSAIHVIH